MIKFYHENVKRIFLAFIRVVLRNDFLYELCLLPSPPLSSKFVLFRSRDHRALQGDPFILACLDLAW